MKPAESAWSRYDAMVSRLQTDASKQQSDNEAFPDAERPKNKRGGVRSDVISKAVDDLTGENWLQTKRPEGAVLEELQDRRVPGVDKWNLRLALDRRVRVGKLKSIGDNGGWVYWSE